MTRVIEFPLKVDGVTALDAAALYALLKWAETHQPELVPWLREQLGESDELLGWPIEELDLSVGAYNALKRENPAMTIGDLIGIAEEDLRKLRNIKSARVIEVKAKLLGLGLTLRAKSNIAPI